MGSVSGCGDLYRSRLSHRTVPHPRPVRDLDRHRDRAWVIGHGHQPVAERRQARTAVREHPLADNLACGIEQADLMLLRAPVDAGEPAYRHLSHGPCPRCRTSRHDACRNLYWRSTARLPTGHPSWSACRGTGPTLVLLARVHEWSLPTGWPARSAYTPPTVPLPDTGARDGGANRAARRQAALRSRGRADRGRRGPRDRRDPRLRRDHRG